MTHRYTRTVLLGALGTSLALAMAACGDSRAATSAPPTVSAAPPSAAPPSSAPSSTAAACRNEDVEVTVTMQEADGQTLRGLVAVTNKSTNPCDVEGRATISLTNAADEIVEVPSKDVDQPGPAEPITLRPGTSAFQGIKWKSCDKGSSSCPAGNGLRFNLQASTDGPAAELSGFPPGEASDLTMASLEQGTLQPSTQGVVAW